MDYIVTQKGFWEEEDDAVLKAIREGFIQTHYAMWKELGMKIELPKLNPANFQFKYFTGNFLENDFWTPPPPINFVHESQNVTHGYNWSCGRGARSVSLS